MEIDFQKLMSTKSDEDLQEYLDNCAKYTANAIEAAIAEMKKRGRIFSEEELNTYKSKFKKPTEFVIEELPLSKKGKRLYWLGLLGFIPAWGAIAGLVLLMLGILRYKDKLLAFIGVACILYTVGYYSYSVYQLRTSDDVDSGFATIAQMQINDLIKDVEFYKIQNGSYPDKLEAIQKNNSLATIVDPILLWHSSTGDLNYRYQKIGERYKLYSVGIDRIDNTVDDIYPTLAVTDTTKIGFIKK
jgi:hypothetical protein